MQMLRISREMFVIILLGLVIRDVMCATPNQKELRIESTDHWTSLNRKEFINYLNLETVFVTGNYLNELGVTLKNHKKLRQLHLCDNKFFELHDNDMVNLDSSSLETLHIDGCDLKTIPNEAFEKLPSLTELNMERNHLKYIPVHAIQSTNVSTLSLSGNVDFNFIKNQSFLASSTLTVFRCNGCGINVIYAETFARLPAVRRIELNQNHITVVYPTAFLRNVQLSVLQMNENQLTAFPISAFKFPPLRELCLDGNNFTTSMTTSILKKRYARHGLRGECPSNVTHMLDDIEDTRLPGISDAFIASYLVLVVIAQGVLAVLLVVLCLRQVYRKKEPNDWDYSSGVLNESDMYQYVK